MIKDDLIGFIKKSEREHEKFNLTVSFGHFLLNNSDLTAVKYEEENGIYSFLIYLNRLGWAQVFENDLLVGLRKGKESISLDVGGQVLWQYEGFNKISELEQAYLDFIQSVFDELMRRSQMLVATGHQPVTEFEKDQVIETARAKALYEYSEDKPFLADFLFSSTGIKISMQYAHVDNFQKRFVAAQVIQPALAALFDNVAWVHGETNEKELFNLNNLVKAPEHYYLIDESLDESFKYADYADFLLKAPAIAYPTDDSLKYVGERTNEETYKAAECLTEEDIKRMISFLRPSVSVNEYGITIGNIDAVPYPLNMALVVLVKAVLYNPDHITALEKVLEELKVEKLIAARNETLEKGLDATIREGIVMDLIKDLFFMVSLTVEPDEQHYLQPFNSLLFKNVKTRNVGAKQFSAILTI